MEQMKTVATLETLLDNGDLQTDLLFRIKKDSSKQMFKKDPKTGLSVFDEGYLAYKKIKTWKVNTHMIKLLFSSVERRLKEQKRRKKAETMVESTFGFQFGGAGQNKDFEEYMKKKNSSKPKRKLKKVKNLKNLKSQEERH